MLRLFPEYLKGEELFGLTVHAVLRIAESVSPAWTGGGGLLSAMGVTPIAKGPCGCGATIQHPLPVAARC